MQKDKLKKKKLSLLLMVIQILSHFVSEFILVLLMIKILEW